MSIFQHYKVILLLAQSLLTICAYSQSTYINNNTVAGYQPLANAHVITKDFLRTRYTINLGSHFNVFMKSFPCFGIRGLNVEVEFGALTGINSTNDTLFSIDGFFCNGLISRDTSSAIKYARDTLSSSGEIIVKVQWQNMTIRGGNPAIDSVNFQIWLYQSGEAEVHFGPIHIGSSSSSVYFPGNSGPAVGLFLSSPGLTMYESIFLTGSPAMPGANRSAPFVGLNNEPQNGQVYTFKYHSPIGLPAFNLEDPILKVFSLPPGGKVLIESIYHTSRIFYYQLRNSIGAVIKEGEGTVSSNSGHLLLEFPDVPPGAYTIILSQEKRTDLFKVRL